MPRRPTERQLYEELLTRYGRTVADAFLAAMDDLRSAVDLQRLIAAIRLGNITEALDALHLQDAALAPLLDAIQGAYNESGRAAASYFPTIRSALGAARVVIRWDARNPRAEAWLREHSASLVTRVMEDQRAGIRRALEAGLVRGENPTTTALDIVGRKSRATGKREGGIIGLTSQQEEFSRNARAELASGDPEQLRSYLKRERRDKRFDRAVSRAIAEEKPVPADVAAKAVTSYRNRLLKLRGDMFGRTESLTALRAAKREAWLQAVESGAVAEADVTRKWRTAGDNHVRHTHQRLSGRIVGLNEPFISPSGARLMFPGDPSAPAAERIGCRCDEEYRIDFLSKVR